MDFVFTGAAESTRNDGSVMVRVTYGEIQFTVFALESGKISFPTTIFVKPDVFTRFYNKATAFVEDYKEKKEASTLNDNPSTILP